MVSSLLTRPRHRGTSGDAQSHASAPTAQNDTYNTPLNTPLSVTGPGVLANDTDPNNKPLTAVQVSSPDRGAVALNADGSFTYTPDGGAAARETFLYQATNGAQPSNVARVEKLEAAGLMEAAGRRVVEEAKRLGTWPA